MEDHQASLETTRMQNDKSSSSLSVNIYIPTSPTVSQCFNARSKPYLRAHE
jgi:hypothetical protein